MATITPSAFVREGAIVLVVSEDRSGASGWKRREVAKIGAQHFTVHGVVEPTGKLIKFRNRTGMKGPHGVDTHDIASDRRDMYVMAVDTEAAKSVMALVDKRGAINRVRSASHAFDKVEQRSRPSHSGERATPAEVDDALAELAAAAVALREVLGVPGGE